MTATALGDPLGIAALFLAACLTALATGIGALPVYASGGDTPARQTALWGVAAGVMGVASIQGLLLPGLRIGDDEGVVAGVIAGALFLLAMRAVIGHRDVHLGTASAADARRALLVFGVLLAHSLPEGLALGSAWARGSADLSLFVFAAIALQNIPEGSATAIGLGAAGIGLGRAFWASVLTSAPQPVGALAAFALVASIDSLLAPAFGFAAGAMLALIVVEIAPAALARATWRAGALGTLGGAVVTAAMGAALGV